MLFGIVEKNVLTNSNGFIRIKQYFYPF